jgi:hypothetical protein
MKLSIARSVPKLVGKLLKNTAKLPALQEWNKYPTRVLAIFRNTMLNLDEKL